MISTIYVSRASRTMSVDDLEQILIASRSNNERHDLTGMLLYREDRFLQVIEGPDDSVHERLKVIFGDERHTNPRVLLSDPVTQRQFPRWTMGFPPVENALLTSSAGYRYAIDDDGDPVGGHGPALRALTRWLQEHRHPTD